MRIDEMISAKLYRLIINLNDVRQSDRELANGLLNDPLTYIPALEAQVKVEVLNKESSYLDGEGGRWGGVGVGG